MKADTGQGRVWTLLFIWPFVGYWLTLNFYEYNIWSQIGICAGWGLFVYGLYRAYKLIRSIWK